MHNFLTLVYRNLASKCLNRRLLKNWLKQTAIQNFI